MAGVVGEEATLVLIKPDAIQKGLVGVTISYLERLKLDVIGAKAVRVTREMAEEHYAQLRSKPFFGDLIDHLTGKIHNTNYVLVLVFWGPKAIERVRQVTGATNPDKADPMTIRGALGRNSATNIMENVIHASADTTEAQREIRLWFKQDELLMPISQSEQCAT
jgi:nucleoside-diphosphate kinase